MDSDDEHSRAAKRQRLSSPTYDEQVELSEDVVDAFDAFERTMSQHPPLSQTRRSQPLTASAKKRRDSAIALALSQHLADPPPMKIREASSNVLDPEGNPFAPRAEEPGLCTSLFKSASHVTNQTHLSQSQENRQPSSSPNIEPAEDLSAWFETSHTPKSGSLFTSAKDIEDNDDALLDEWFSARAPPGLSGFQSAKNIKTFNTPVSEPSPSKEGPARVYPSFVSGASLHAGSSAHKDISPSKASLPGVTGFISGSSVLNPSSKKPSWTMPSEEALKKAAQKMKQWEHEEQEAAMDADQSFNDEGDSFDFSVDSPLKSRSTRPDFPLPSFGRSRTALQDVENSSPTASQNRQTGFAIVGARPSLTKISTPSNSAFRPPIVSGLAAGGIRSSAKPFKSPLLVKSTPTRSISARARSPLNPKSSFASFVPPALVTPIRPSTPNERESCDGGSSAPATPFSGSSAGFVTPQRSSALLPRRTPARGSKKSGFVTPFKPGFRPGEPGRATLSANARPVPYAVTARTPGPAASSASSKGKEREVYFDLTQPKERQTLASSGLRPQQYSREQLEEMGINVTELEQMTPESAIYYRFHSATESPMQFSTQYPPPATQATLGPQAALDELKRLGCTLATKEWVHNHWGLVLWKLAGMVCLDPAAEDDPRRKRWCWRELMRQLRYRYERELNQGQRPPLRKIVAQDVSASAPMILCVSNISWTEGGTDDDGTRLPSMPEIEVTDGWYRIRAEIDEPLVRTTRKGKIRVGSKIAVMGCRLRSERKDGGEILEAAGSISLQINGNSSHLAPWHAKLGFQKEPFVATLGGLDATGGLVPSLEVEIVKVYPVAYLEFRTAEDGRRNQEGPRNEREEAIAQEKWEIRREAEARKLRAEYEEATRRLSRHADQLEHKAAPFYNLRSDQTAPSHIDDLLLELEDLEDARDLVRRITPEECAWLANAVRDKISRDEERMHQDIDKDLESVCPLRNVRSFRIVLVRDARTYRRPQQREAQITVWDVLSLQLLEDDKPGDFKPGQRLLVTNLYPSQPSAWMPARQDNSMIYLTTRKHSVWTLLGKNNH